MRKPKKPYKPKEPTAPEEYIEAEIELFGGPYSSTELTFGQLRERIEELAHDSFRGIHFDVNKAVLVYREPEHYGDCAYVEGARLYLKIKRKDPYYAEKLARYKRSLSKYKKKMAEYKEKKEKYDKDILLWEEEQKPKIKAKKEKELKSLKKKIAALEKELGEVKK